jgi:kynurenine formamidase
MATMTQPEQQRGIETVAGLLGPSPLTNWGRWGPDDEVGALNHLDAAEVLRGIRAVRSGQTFTLQYPIGVPERPDPVHPGRMPARRWSVSDEGFWARGEGEPSADGHHWADDVIEMHLQGSTQYDALGHYWYDGQLWNGYDAMTTDRELRKASVLPIAQRGVVGHGVLIDMARARDVEYLVPGESFGLEQMLAAADELGVVIEPRDILMLRTGRLRYFEAVGAAQFYVDWREPGLEYSPDLVEWFQDMQIPNLVTDLIANEATTAPGTSVELPLHSALMRNLGVTFTEVADLDPFALACAKDGRWDCLYVAAPLKVHGASGSPVNPVVIR